MSNEQVEVPIEDSNENSNYDFLSTIVEGYNIPFHYVDKGTDLSKQNFEDVTWYRRLYSLRKLGTSNIFNIYPDIIITETSDNKKIITSNCLDSAIGDTNKTKNYYALFVASDKNIVFAAITLSGDLYFVSEALNLIGEHSSEEAVKEIVAKTCKYTSQILTVSQRSVNSTGVLKSDLISYLLVDLCIKLGSGFFDFDHNIKRLGCIINDSMKSLFRDETNSPTMFNFLLGQNDMYRTVVHKFMENQDRVERKAMERGILIGSKFFTGFQRAGYIYDLDTGRWEKRVDIHPEFCLWGGVLYKIPDKFKDRFFVETLTFDPNTLKEEAFVINAKGKHPNVSGSNQACIGSELGAEFKRLIRNKGLMAQEYVNFLIHIEEALKIVNFDSSYYDFKKATGVSPCSVLVRADACNSSIGKSTIKGSLRRV